MSQPIDQFDVTANVEVYNRANGERMSLQQKWVVDMADSVAMFHALARFGEIADQMKASGRVC